MSNILHSQDRGDVLAHVADNLRRLRAAAGLSQTALSQASGVSRRMIVAIESGNANISLSTLDRIAAALSVGFVDLVRDASRQSRSDINQVTWRGRMGGEAVLLASVSASVEAQLWLWSLAAGECYIAEPDPEGWHEMIYVIEGVLDLELSGSLRVYTAGQYVAYGTAQAYRYANRGSGLLRFIRNVIS